LLSQSFSAIIKPILNVADREQAPFHDDERRIGPESRVIGASPVPDPAFAALETETERKIISQ
jgi:hypothetical protein